MEIFDLVNESGEVIGTASRQQCHGNPALLHPTVHVLVFNNKHELWMQKRAMTKDIQPGKWDTSVGGHKAAGEPTIDGAIREMHEEIGIKPTVNDLQLCYTYIMRNEIESEYITTYIYILRDNEQIEFDPDEIDEGRFFSRTEIESRLGTDFFTPNFEDEWQRFMDFNKEFFDA